jgi:iron complex transport system substrate-binding protein
MLMLLGACTGGNLKKISAGEELHTDEGIHYAKRFSIARGPRFTTVYLFGNRNNRDTTAAFLLSEKKYSLPGYVPVTTPCKKIAALSSIYAAMLCELGEGEGLAAIDNIDYVNNPIVLEKFKKGELKELARTPEINIEQTIALDPDIIFYYGMGDNDGEKDKRLKESGIPIAICLDHLEEHPLARAEWIKFFAVFVNREREADSIFAAVEKNYLHLRRLTDSLEDREKPTVFSEIKLGDVWYMPGGRSFMATLLKDSGANYLWKDDENSGSLPLSFEQVYARARDADFWINLPLVKSKEQLVAQEGRYASFKAFETGQLYNNTRNPNRFGYSPYWETGMIHPERIISDLVQIFHPSLVQAGKLYYYEKLK